MERDYVLEQVLQKVSKDKKINQMEVDKVINLMFKGLNEFMTKEVKQVRVPYLGTFRLRKNFKRDYDNRGTVHSGEPDSGTES